MLLYKNKFKRTIPKSFTFPLPSKLNKESQARESIRTKSLVMEGGINESWSHWGSTSLSIYFYLKLLKQSNILLNSASNLPNGRRKPVLVYFNSSFTKWKAITHPDFLKLRELTTMGKQHTYLYSNRVILLNLSQNSYRFWKWRKEGVLEGAWELVGEIIFLFLVGGGVLWRGRVGVWMVWPLGTLNLLF